MCFCAGSISVWGLVVGNSHTVVPCSATAEFFHFQFHDKSVCLRQPRLGNSLILYSFYLSSSSSYPLLPHGWLVIIHSPPSVKRIRLAINARLGKAGVAVLERRAQRTQTLLLLAKHDIIPFVWPLAGRGLGTCSLAVWC